MTQSLPVPIVSPTWLANGLADPETAKRLVIVDCRFALSDPALGQRQYAEGHLPDAHYLDLNRDLSSPVQPHGGRHPLPDLAAFQTKLRSLGINADPPSWVIAYDDSRFAFASRLWWLLNYLGHTHVAVLDGGIQGWTAAGFALTDAVPEAGSGNFVGRPQPNRIVDIETVKARKDRADTVLIDSRSPERYRGEQEPIDPIAGSIPGAVNYFWKGVSNEAGKLRSPNDLQQHWTTLESADEVIVYCGSGVTACVNLLSQQVAGLPMAKLYVGGWSDWCSYQTETQ
ncbi:MAG: sulfurtransferase [Cyanobacteria bacterium P01_A01_bin.123]